MRSGKNLPSRPLWIFAGWGRTFQRMMYGRDWRYIPSLRTNPAPSERSSRKLPRQGFVFMSVSLPLHAEPGTRARCLCGGRVLLPPFFHLMKKPNLLSMTPSRTKGRFKPRKMREVILYLLNKCGSMTKEKLCGLLYFCDFDHYEKHQKSITGATYIKKP